MCCILQFTLVYKQTWSVFLLLLCFILAHVDIPPGLVDVILLCLQANHLSKMVVTTCNQLLLVSSFLCVRGFFTHMLFLYLFLPEYKEFLREDLSFGVQSKHFQLRQVVPQEVFAKLHR
jgi:hypothetical protein